MNFKSFILNFFAVIGAVGILTFAGCDHFANHHATTSKTRSANPLPATFPPLFTQPEYSSTPHYCLIAIGPEREKKIWTVLDDHTLYVDLNANGDLTEEGERIAGEVEMTFEDTTYVNYFIGMLEHDSILHTDANLRAAITENEVRASINLFLDGFVGSANNSHVLQLEMNPDPAKASLVHFGGPVSMGLYEEPQVVVAGEEMKFYALVGTPGDGKGTLTALAHADIPDEAHPKAEFQFPNKDASKPDIELTTYLKERC